MFFKNGKRIVILGGGFAGLAAARRLPSSYKVTLIDRKPYFEFLPNIHELISLAKSPEILRLSLVDTVERFGHCFVGDSVVHIDGRANKVVTGLGEEIEYDALLVAIGGEDNSFGVPGVGEHAIRFKSIDDAWSIGQELLHRSMSDMTYDVVIVGGGFEGIEALGEILRRFGDDIKLRVTLIERNSRLMPSAPVDVDRRVREIVAPYPVRIVTGESVKEVTADGVRCESGKFHQAEVTIWTGGLKPSPLLLRSGLTASPDQWLSSANTLQSRNYDNIFVAGDVIDFPRNGHQMSQQAYHAMDSGEHAAENMVRFLKGKTLNSFHPVSKPLLVSFGDMTGFLVWGNKVVESNTVHLAKEAIYHAVMAGFDLSWGTASTLRLLKRTTNTLTEVAIPMLKRPAYFRKHPAVKVLAWRGEPQAAGTGDHRMRVIKN